MVRLSLIVDFDSVVIVCYKAFTSDCSLNECGKGVENCYSLFTQNINVILIMRFHNNSNIIIYLNWCEMYSRIYCNIYQTYFQVAIVYCFSLVPYSNDENLFVPIYTEWPVLVVGDHDYGLRSWVSLRFRRNTHNCR